MAGIISIIIGYLLGSISSAILVCKIMKLPDPRTEGSQNAGGTNVLRMGGKQAGIYVIIGDVLKGVIAIWIAKLFGVHGVMLGLTAVAVVAGHIYPCFFGFKGGKGVAPMLGALVGLSLVIGAVAAITWVIVAAIFRYASLASLVTAVLSILYVLVLMGFSLFLPMLIIAGLIIWKHKENIERLKAGTENKISFGESS